MDQNNQQNQSVLCDPNQKWWWRLNQQAVPLHCKVLFADGVIEEFEAVVLYHRLHKRSHSN